MNAGKNKYSVLVVAPSRKTRGGITSVVTSYTTTFVWEKWNCRWIETHIDRSALHKLFFFFKSFLQYLFIIHRYRIVHIHFSEPVSAIRKLFFFLVAKWLGKKVILHFHSFSIETTLNGKFPGLYTFLFTRADLVIALSEYWKKAIEDKYPGKCVVNRLYNPYNEKKLDKSLRKEKNILFAGTLNSRKGYADLINAFAMVSPGHPDWTLVFAGNGEIEKATMQAREKGIEKKVRFLGWVSGKDKDEHFQKASIFCLPSYAEGFPMAVIDAVSYTLPVVTTPVGGILDVFQDGKEVAIAEPGSITQLAEKLDLLINDEKLRDYLSKNAQAVLEKNFKLEIITRELDNMYASVA